MLSAAILAVFKSLLFVYYFLLRRRYVPLQYLFYGLLALPLHAATHAIRWGVLAPVLTRIRSSHTTEEGGNSLNHKVYCVVLHALGNVFRGLWVSDNAVEKGF